VKIKDSIYKDKQDSIEPFQFNRDVANAFDNMANRSIPFYKESQSFSLLLLEELFQNKAPILDLGCSTANTIIQIHEFFATKNIYPEFIGVDQSAPMIERSREKIKQLKLLKATLVEEDINQFKFDGEYEVVILNYTLQFIPKEQRKDLLKKIYKSLIPGGMILMSEKLLLENEDINSSYTKIYYDLKKRNGYSQLEISQKREALENVLVPSSYSENLIALKNAGFEQADCFLRWFNFASFVGLKK